jgi:hypothetical protein
MVSSPPALSLNSQPFLFDKQSQAPLKCAMRQRNLKQPADILNRATPRKAGNSLQNCVEFILWNLFRHHLLVVARYDLLCHKIIVKWRVSLIAPLKVAGKSLFATYSGAKP